MGFFGANISLRVFSSKLFFGANILRRTVSSLETLGLNILRKVSSSIVIVLVADATELIEFLFNGHRR